MNVQGNPSMQEKQKYDIPLFDFEAYGSPLHWNENSRTIVWGKKARQLFRPVPGAVVDPNRIITFFRKRFGSDGEPVSDLLGYPEAACGSWFGRSWLAYTESICFLSD